METVSGGCDGMTVKVMLVVVIVMLLYLIFKFSGMAEMFTDPAVAKANAVYALSQVRAERFVPGSQAATVGDIYRLADTR